MSHETDLENLDSPAREPEYHPTKRPTTTEAHTTVPASKPGNFHASIGPEKDIFSVKLLITCIFGFQKNCSIETVLLSTHNICIG